jgi:menaquinone-dependent protoporphyrinogen oxidase
VIAPDVAQTASRFASDMTPTVLVAFATKHGSTRQVAEEVAERLGTHGFAAFVRPAGDVDSLEGYQGVVLGGAIYTGRLHADARTFLRLHRSELATRPLAVFAMGPRTLAEEDLASSRAQLDAALAREPTLQPFATAIFGGVFDPVQHHFPFNRMPASDVRDWQAIRTWADDVAAQITRLEAVV